MIQYILLIFGSLATLLTATAQTTPIPMGSGRLPIQKPDDSTTLQFAYEPALQSNNAKVPESIHASDGTYDKFVLVRWEPKEQGGLYRLFRAVSRDGGSMRELTKTWQKSTWFCDYTAEKGQDYYYAVMESDGQKTAPLSRFDKGFLRKSDDIAQDEPMVSANFDKYAAGKIVFALVAEVSPDSAISSNNHPINLRIGLQNIFEEMVPRTELRIYLSQNATWDFEDILLHSKTFSGFPALAKASLLETIVLPKNILPGTYNLLVVASPEGDIMNSKTGFTPITIVRR